ncbi:MAG: hypothetical protein H6696_14170 [Deferribacteres bacterium]|nr:hypothetical protein [Deferribacteres bacterium]
MYSPKISEELIPVVKLISTSSGKPMTYVVNTILSYSIYVFFLMLGPEANQVAKLQSLIQNKNQNPNKESRNGKNKYTHH